LPSPSGSGCEETDTEGGCGVREDTVRQKEVPGSKAQAGSMRGGHFRLLFFWWNWGLNSGLHTSKLGTLLLEVILEMGVSQIICLGSP
jgi:hypothetical protein